jgi:hypothetical protein
MSLKRILMISLGCSLLTGCSGKGRTQIFDREFVHASNAHVAVGIDLRDDDKPRVGLVVRNSSNTSALFPRTMVVLPFASSGQIAENEIHSTWGSYPACCTLVEYSSVAGQFSIPIEATFDPSPEEALADFGSLSGHLYLLRPNPLKRIFVYNYGGREARSEFASLLEQGAIQPDALWVVVPSDAEIVRPRGHNDAVAPIVEEMESNSFGFAGARGASDNWSRVQMEYNLQTTKNEKLLAQLGSKLAAELGTPLVGMLLIGAAGSHRRLRTIVIAVGLAIQVGLVVWLTHSAWSLKEAAYTEAIGSVIVGFIILAFTGIGLWLAPKKA